MKKEINISDFSPHLFWDVDIEKMDMEKSKRTIIHKVLEYGVMKDWELIKMVYGLEEIKNVSIELRDLDDVTLSFLCRLFKLEKNEFRCYTMRQSNRGFWSY